MAAEQVLLQREHLVRLDSLVGQLAEAGVDAVDGGSLGQQVRQAMPGLFDAAPGRRREAQLLDAAVQDRLSVGEDEVVAGQLPAGRRAVDTVHRVMIAEDVSCQGSVVSGKLLVAGNTTDNGPLTTDKIMRAQLVPLDGGSPIDILKDLTVVGRKEGCDLRLNHKSVSKMHCVIVKTDGLLLLRDLGSTNGTRVNGQRVRRAALLPNDQLSIASH